MNNKMPKKPETQTEQIDKLWDVVANHVITKLHWLDVKMNFLLAFTALLLTFLGILIVRG